MQDLRKQLMKAGLIDKKKKKHADRQVRTEQRKKGAQTVAEEEAERRRRHEQRREEQRRQDRKREEARKKERATKEERFRLRDIVQQGIVREGRRGGRRFHFVTRQGRIPFVQISEELALQLEKGRVAIVEMPVASREEFEIVERPTAEKIAAIDREMIRFWNA